MVWGGELLIRDGEPVGQVTSATWAATVGAGVGLAWVHAPPGVVADAAFVRAGRYEIDVGGRRTPVRISLKPLYDPSGEKIAT